MAREVFWDKRNDRTQPYNGKELLEKALGHETMLALLLASQLLPLLVLLYLMRPIFGE